MIAGGKGTLIGPVCGAILLTVLPEVLRGFGDSACALRRCTHSRRLVHARRHSAGGADISRAVCLPQIQAGCRMDAMRSAAISAAEVKALDAPGTRLFRGHGLNKSFGGVHAVRDISLSISQGEVFAIIGPNGAGKIDPAQPDERPLSARLWRYEFWWRRSGRASRAQARAARASTDLPENTTVQPFIRARQCYGRLPCPSRPSGVAVCRARSSFRRDHASCIEQEELCYRSSISSRDGRHRGLPRLRRRRMLELARALATFRRLLMADEPAAGLNAAEVEKLLIVSLDYARVG